MAQAGLRDILTLLGVFGHLSAPFLAPPASEIVEDTFSISRTVEVDSSIARIQLEEASIQLVQSQEVSITRVVGSNNPISTGRSNTFNVQMDKTQEFER